MTCLSSRKYWLVALAILIFAGHAATASAHGVLSVSKSPPAAAGGTVSAMSSGIEEGTPISLFICGADCAEPFTHPSCEDPPCSPHITHGAVLTATPPTGWAFGSWTNCTNSGAGENANVCSVVGGSDRHVVANFVDPDPPQLTLDGPPLNTVLSDHSSWTFTANATDGTGIAGVEFWVDDELRITDTAEPYQWDVPRTALSHGEKTTRVKVSVRALSVGGQEATSARAYDVDFIKPTIDFLAVPAERIANRDVEFVFTVSDVATTTVLCGLAPQPTQPCTTKATHALAELADGPHTLYVKAVDRAGNEWEAASSEFYVDTTPPETEISGGPAEGSRTDEPTARFAFTSPDGATFRCSVDGAPYATCAAWHAVSGLRVGPHSFAVVAVDSVGNVDPTPARRNWTVLAVDRDNDGHNRDSDCDDTRIDVHPGAAEVADNGIDEDCDGADTIDLDRDRDGYNRPYDCDDANAQIHPGAAEMPENGRDESCDGADAVVLDHDGDGYNRPQDCNDADAAISPGARDVPADGVDQDCDGTAAPWPRLRARVSMAVEYAGRHSRVVNLTVFDVEPKTAVTVTCKGRGCPFKTKRATARRAGKLVLTKLFKGRRLPAGTQVDVAVRHPSAIGPWSRFVTRAAAIPKRTERCLAPGAQRPTAC
jgi:hypothetical protein